MQCACAPAVVVNPPLWLSDVHKEGGSEYRGIVSLLHTHTCQAITREYITSVYMLQGICETRNFASLQYSPLPDTADILKSAHKNVQINSCQL